MTSSILQNRLDKLLELHPKIIDLSLDRINTLLVKLNNPQDKLPPVIHVAGTNGKGSTIAFLRSILETAGHKAHVYTSPHLVRFNERIVLGGKTVDDNTLINAINVVEKANDGAPITFFEITTAVAFYLFAQHPADVVLLETGLGGRLDASNVVNSPAACVITPISIDHQSYLGNTIQEIAAEKAGIIKPKSHIIIGPQTADAMTVLLEHCQQKNIVPVIQTKHCEILVEQDKRFKVLIQGVSQLLLEPKYLNGGHQLSNALTAYLTIDRLQPLLPCNIEAIQQGIQNAQWPARLQQCTYKGQKFLLDGAHNAAGANALADYMRHSKQCYNVICGMMENKQQAVFLKILAPYIHKMQTVAIPGHQCICPEKLASMALESGITAKSVHDWQQALQNIGNPKPTIILGSLYLAGHVLKHL